MWSKCPKCGCQYWMVVDGKTRCEDCNELAPYEKEDGDE